MKKFNREEAFIIVNHACVVAKNRGEQQSDICEAIEIDDGYLSRCKKGTKKLSQDKLMKLISLYGQPNFLNQGVYLSSEYYADFNCFADEFKISHEYYLVTQLLCHWENEIFQENMPLIMSAAARVEDPELTMLERLKSRLLEVLDDDAFLEWFDLFEPNHSLAPTLMEHLTGKTNIPSYTRLENILEHHGIYIPASANCNKESFFQRLGMMHYQFECIKKFDFENTIVKPFRINEEYVIQGHCIYENSGRIEDSQGIRASKFIREYSAQSFNSHFSSVKFSQQGFDKIDILTKYHMGIFVTDNLNYYCHLILIDSSNNTARDLLIHLEPTNVLGDIYRILRLVTSSEPMSEFGLKKALAEEGCTIPGVTILQ